MDRYEDEEDNKAIARRLQDVKTSDEISDADRQVILELEEKIEHINDHEDRWSGSSHESLLSTTLQIAKQAPWELHETLKARQKFPEAELAEPAFGEEEPPHPATSDIVGWIKDHYSGSGIDKRLMDLRTFGEIMTTGTGHPPRFAKIKTNHSDSDPTPARSEVVTYAEVMEVVRIQSNIRDMAIVAIQYATGGRPKSELYDLTLRYVEDCGDRFLLSIPTAEETKTGARDIFVYIGAPFLRKWLEIHPGNDTEGGRDPDMALWTKLPKHCDDPMESIGYSAYKKPWRKARNSDAINITKPLNPQHFRRSRASVLASSKYISQVDLENHFGWVRGSTSAAHYIARFGEKTGEHVALADGHPIDMSEPDPIAPVPCEHCERWTPRLLETCLWCDRAIDPETPDPDRLSESLPADTGANIWELVKTGELTTAELELIGRLETTLRYDQEFWAQLESITEVARRLEAAA